MRKTVKILHTIAACGLTGSLLVYMIVLIKAPQASAQQYADMRQTINALCEYVLIPSLAIALISGLVAMIVHRPFQELRWVWLKALLGLSMFEATLAVTQAKASLAATLSAQVAEGLATPDALTSVLNSEWTSLFAITALAVAQTVIGVWRPPLKGRK